MQKEKLLKLLKSRTWSTQVFNGAMVYIHAVATVTGWQVGRTFGVSYRHFCYSYEHGQVTMYYDVSDWERISNAFNKKITNTKKLVAIIRLYQKQYATAVAASQYNARDLTKLSTRRLVALSSKLAKRSVASVGVGHVIEAVSYGTEQYLHAHLGGIVSPDELSCLTSPTEQSFASESAVSLWAVKKSPDQAAAAKKYLRKFGWSLNTYLGRRNFSVSEILIQARSLKEIPKAVDYKQLQLRKKTILQRIGASPELRLRLALTERLTKWQDDRKKHILQTIEVWDPVLDELAARFGIDPRHIKILHPDELTYANLSAPIFRAELVARFDKSVFYVTQKQTRVFTGTSAAYLATGLSQEHDHAAELLQGKSASPGVVRGVVKVCTSVAAISAFPNGSVLVAPMTRPEYLPAMRKAVAFVTDEGGVTCHAAIVAREMHKPCVIGTTKATRVLSDGDTVEVNGSLGTVRVIKRHA